MASCNPQPTATQFGTQTSVSSSVSTSNSVTSLPSTPTTIFSTSCIVTATDPLASIGCISSTVITSVSTIPGGESTVQVPITIPVTFSNVFPTATLFSPCPSSPDPPSSSTTTTTSNQAPTSSPTAPSPSDTDLTSSNVLLTSTAPGTTFLTPTSTTLANGQIVPTSATVTSGGSVFTTMVSTQVPKTTQQDNDSNSPNIGAIVGGVLGGFVGLICIVGLVWFFIRRHRTNNWDDLFEKSYERDFSSQPVTPAFRGSSPPPPRTRTKSRLTLDDDEPKPYQYGLVGHAASPPGLSSPPHSPPPTDTTFPSLPNTPGSTSIGGQHTRTTTGEFSRPSTAGSGQPLMKPQFSGGLGHRPNSMSADETGSITDGRLAPPTPLTLANWNPNTDYFLSHDTESIMAEAQANASRRQSLTEVPPTPAKPLQVVNPSESAASDVDQTAQSPPNHMALPPGAAAPAQFFGH